MDFSIGRLLCVAIAAWALPASVSFAEETTLVPVATQWKVKDVSHDKDLSGIACMKLGDVHRCVIAVDEGVSASIARLEGNEIRQERLIALISPMPDEELDAEGAAFDPDTKLFYVVGSHGRKRHCCENNPSSFNLVRFRLSESPDLPSNPLAGAIEVS